MKSCFSLIQVRIFTLLLAVFPFSAAFAQSRPDALAEYRAGNYERSIQICRSEITENSGNLESHVVICWSLLKLGRYEEALRYARAGRLLSRYDIRVTEILGEAYYHQGQNREALQYFQEYVSLAPPEADRIATVYYFIGEIYIRLGKFRHADIALSTAVHWAPGNALWWARLAYAQENAGDLSEAVNAYEKALGLNSQLADARRGLERARQTLNRR
jgi:tetratricopeptide (TPR) repeat protein